MKSFTFIQENIHPLLLTKVNNLYATFPSTHLIFKLSRVFNFIDWYDIPLETIKNNIFLWINSLR